MATPKDHVPPSALGSRRATDPFRRASDGAGNTRAAVSVRVAVSPLQRPEAGAQRSLPIPRATLLRLYSMKAARRSTRSAATKMWRWFDSTARATNSKAEALLGVAEHAEQQIVEGGGWTQQASPMHGGGGDLKGGSGS
jgi:hypothetical protein